MLSFFNPVNTQELKMFSLGPNILSRDAQAIGITYYRKTVALMVPVSRISDELLSRILEETVDVQPTPKVAGSLY